MAGICNSGLMTPQLLGFPNHFHVLLSESVDGQSREGRPPLLDLGAGLEGATFLSPARGKQNDQKPPLSGSFPTVLL